jgi:hypothetical protein
MYFPSPPLQAGRFVSYLHMLGRFSSYLQVDYNPLTSEKKITQHQALLSTTSNVY